MRMWCRTSPSEVDCGRMRVRRDRVPTADFAYAISGGTIVTRAMRDAVEVKAARSGRTRRRKVAGAAANASDAEEGETGRPGKS